MIIQRNTYLEQLIHGRRNGLIKIVTGIRRSGKSFLLFELFHAYLISQGIDSSHIIEIALDDRRHAKLRNPDEMIAYIDSRIIDNQPYTIILDEVQMMDEFVDVMNSLLHCRNVDIYVTGSNSHFLSSDVATEFRGRGDEIHIYPLSFNEYYSAIGGDKQTCWKKYYKHGGLPQILSFENDEKVESYLMNLCQSVYIKDILERHRIRNKTEFSELLNVISSSIGSPCNPNKLANSFKSARGITIDKKTISNYLQYMENAFIVERSFKFDVKCKKYINTLSKYYFQDVGIRNALLSFRQHEEPHLMENIIYNELRMRNYRVDVGFVELRSKTEQNKYIRKQLEVDFVANKGNQRLYIQSALSIADEIKRNQESASLNLIGDGYKRIIIVRDDISPYIDENGFYIVGLFDFLLKPDWLAE